MRRKKNTIHPETLSYITYRARKKKSRVSIWSMMFNYRVSYSKKIVPNPHI